MNANPKWDLDLSKGLEGEAIVVSSSVEVARLRLSGTTSHQPVGISLLNISTRQAKVSQN